MQCTINFKTTYDGSPFGFPLFTANTTYTLLPKWVSPALVGMLNDVMTKKVYFVITDVNNDTWDSQTVPTEKMLEIFSKVTAFLIKFQM